MVARRRRVRAGGIWGFGAGALGCLLLVGLLAPAVQAQVQAGVVIDRDGLRSIHLAVGQVYGVPVTRVAHYAPTWLHPEELPVIYLVAREARVSPDVVIALREQGWSWVDITYNLGISPGIFVAHLPTRIGPPYGHAHGYWRKRGRTHYRYLTDRHVVDYVNVYLWAQYHRRPVTEVIIVRERYGDWMRFARSPSWRAAPPPRATAVQGIPSDRGRTAEPRQAVPRAGAPAPSRAAPAPDRARPAPSRAAPAPSRTSPAPSRAAPAPSRAAPAPSRAAPAPSRAVPAPSRAAPAPSRAAPSRAAPAPSRAAPAPSRAAPSRQAQPRSADTPRASPAAPQRRASPPGRSGGG